ncbi:unnamed protein product [Cercospora beticola]|nr:unnamed protein product [Cercospora beticola]
MPGHRQKFAAALGALVVTAVVIAKRNPIRRLARRMKRSTTAPFRTRMATPEAESSFQPEPDVDELDSKAETVDLLPEAQSGGAHSAGFTAALSPGPDADRIEPPTPPESQSGIKDEICTDKEPVDVRGDAADAEVQKSPVATDPESEQAARANTYVRFNIEEESDYTRGPIRIVNAFDGVEKVSSLLLNLDLSAKVRAIILSRRDFEAAQIEAAIECQQWRQLQSELAYRISSLTLQLSIADDQSEMDPDDIEDLEASQEELKKLNAFQDKITRVFGEIECQVQSYYNRLQLNHREVEAYFEEAFVAARLVHPEPAADDTGFDYHDFDVVYQGFCENEYVPREDASDAGRQVSRDEEPLIKPLGNIPNDEDPDWQRKKQALDTWHQARLKLQKAQEAFDAREDDAHQDKCRAEEAKEDLLDWSLHWVQRGRELTRALIEAEEEDDKAREAAEEAGVDVARHYQNARFHDHASDGYGSGYERGGIAQAPRERIFEWMSQISDGEAGDPNKQELVPRPEIDDWDYEDIAINESRSVIDDAPRRQKIDSWSRACGRGGH